jgi:hypothetical protein
MTIFKNNEVKGFMPPNFKNYYEAILVLAKG